MGKTYTWLYTAVPQYNTDSERHHPPWRGRISCHAIATITLLVLNVGLFILLLRDTSPRVEDCIRPQLTFCTSLILCRYSQSVFGEN